MENIIEKLLPFAQAALGIYVVGAILGMAVFVITAIWVLKVFRSFDEDKYKF